MPVMGLTSGLNSNPSSLSMDDLNASMTATTCGSEQNAGWARDNVDVDVGVFPTGGEVGDSVEMNVCVTETGGRGVDVAGGSGVKEGTADAIGVAGIGRQALNSRKHTNTAVLNFILCSSFHP